jgi:FAD/FMN-containing dehydrogenase
MARGELSPRLRSLLGSAATVGATPGGAPLVAPDSESACALLLRTASVEGWRVRIEGAGSWMPRDAGADVVLSTTRLSRLIDVSPSDLVATAEAGIAWSVLRRGLADQGAWLALDAPGGDRTLGSLVATGTTGPLRAGFGMLRDQILGLTLVTGDGRTVRVGGRVMKNVAGYDLAKLAAGSFGAFGILTSLHLRLRAVPRADLTLLAHGQRDALVDAARAILAAGLAPAALELVSPRATGSRAWTLAVRLTGADGEVAADRQSVLETAGVEFAECVGAEAAAFWSALLGGALAAPVTVRLGAVPDGLEDALDLLAHHLDEAVATWITATVPAGIVRWSGEATPEALLRFRTAAAEREWPLTLERAPWDIRSRVGHFGAYREGVVRLVGGLRRAFDPAGVLVAPLGTDA